jgi:TRAP-type C4-dicarboxylate transport system substrate-binding protein
MTPIRQMLCATFAVLCVAAPTVQAETFKLASNVPAGHSLVKHGIAPWMACVKERSKGELDFSFFPGAQLATAAASLDAINKGLADISMVVPSALTDKLPLTAISLLPDMGASASEMAAAFRKVMEARGPLAEELAANRMMVLQIAMLPPYQVIHKGAPLQTVEQMQGRKIRVSGGLMGLTVRAVGGVPADIPAPDAYIALQQGTVDGTIFALSSVYSYKLHEIVKSISTNGNFGGAPALLSMDTGVWAKLSPAKQAIFNECTREHDVKLGQALDQENEELKARFAAAGVTMYSFSPEALAEISRRLASVNAEYVKRISARGIKAQEVYDAYRKALGK